MTTASGEESLTNLNMAQSEEPKLTNENDVRRKTSHDDEEPIPRPKRIACVICRKRKLKCDGTKPSCGTCTRLNHDCAYDEVRRKSGPKRGYVKALEARLAQVETLLKTQETVDKQEQDVTAMNVDMAQEGQFPQNPNFISTDEGVNFTIGNRDGYNYFEEPMSMPNDTSGSTVPDFLNYDVGLGTDQISWEMIGLGIEEPLPPQESIDEL